MKTITALLNVSVMGTALLLAANEAKATYIVSDLVSSASGIEGVKNAPGNSYSQGFDLTGASNVGSLTIDLSVAATSKDVFKSVTDPDTMSIYLNDANSSGTPTGSPLATIATGISAGTIEAGTDLGYGSGGGNDFEIYQDTFNFGSLNLAAGDYAIVVVLTNGDTDDGKEVGWGEISSGSEPAGLVGQTQNDPDGTDPYATLGLGPDSPSSLPDSSSTALLFGAVLTGIGFVRRRLA